MSYRSSTTGLMANTVQELVEEAEPADVTEEEILELRAGLDRALTEELSGWDRPSGLLRITKDRLRRGRTCPAQLIGGGSAPMNEHLAVGRVIDVAASVIAVAPDTPHGASGDAVSVTETWHDAIAAPLRAEDPELEEWYAALSPGQQLEHNSNVAERCEELKRSMGDLTEFTVISQNRTTVELAADVVVSARPDLVVMAAERVLVEVKSGKGYGIAEELAFYALVETLCGGAAPAVVAGLTLVPSATIHPLRVDADLLGRAAERVVETAQLCREVDESFAARRWPRTFPGLHCGFCDLAERCPDIPDEHLFEAQQRAAHDIDDDDDAMEEEPW